MKFYKIYNDVYVLKFTFWGLPLISLFFLTGYSFIYLKPLIINLDIVELNVIFLHLIGFFFFVFASICSFETGYYRFDFCKKTLSWKTIRFMRRKHGEIYLKKGTKVKLKAGFRSKSNHLNLNLFNEENKLNMLLHNTSIKQSNKQLSSIASELNKLLYNM